MASQSEAQSSIAFCSHRWPKVICIELSTVIAFHGKVQAFERSLLCCASLSTLLGDYDGYLEGVFEGYDLETIYRLSAVALRAIPVRSVQVLSLVRGQTHLTNFNVLQTQSVRRFD